MKFINNVEVTENKGEVQFTGATRNFMLNVATKALEISMSLKFIKKLIELTPVSHSNFFYDIFSHVVSFVSNTAPTTAIILMGGALVINILVRSIDKGSKEQTKEVLKKSLHTSLYVVIDTITKSITKVV